ncbi:MAG: integrase [Cyanobacteria bacterium P01_A01_bin.84]
MGKDWSVDAVNTRLKAAKTGVTVVQRGNVLNLRATLPLKPGLTGKPKQQYISLGYRGNVPGLQRAEAEAKVISGLLVTGEFDWNRYLKNVKTDSQIWIEKFREDYFRKHGESDRTKFNYENNFNFAFKKIGDNLTCDELIKVAVSFPANSSRRARTVASLKALAEFAKIECNISPYKGNYGNRKTKERHIPSDEEIEEKRHLFIDSQWLTVYELMAVYGLRNHEVFFCEVEDIEKFTLKISEGKTGPRRVYPLNIDWITKWEIFKHFKIPSPARNYRESGNKINRAFKNRSVGFVPYALRHAYAIRAHNKYRISVAIASAWLGHSPSTHLNIYQRWISRNEHEEAFESLVLNK